LEVVQEHVRKGLSKQDIVSLLNRKSERIPRSAPSPKLLWRVGDLLQGMFNSLGSNP
jgi:hypothetical protein